MSSGKNKFLWSFHYFRAFAILNIIFIHTWRFPSRSEYAFGSNLVADVRDMLFHGSTIYFLFISGFLFHYLSYRFQIGPYYISKIKNVVSPYIIISVFIIFAEDLIGAKANTPFLDYLHIIPQKLILGTASFQFWYIPFIMIVFLMSPFFLAIDKKHFIKYVPFLFLLPVLGTRTQVYITFWQFVYFLPAYLIGIYTSMHYNFVMNFVKIHFKGITATAFAVSVALLFVNHDALYYNLFSPRESLVYIQKISITFLILHVSRSLVSNRFPILGIIANCSFALYFVHAIIDRHLKKIYFIVDRYTTDLLKIPLSLCYVLSLIVITVLFCLIFKRIMGKYSRYLIGY